MNCLITGHEIFSSFSTIFKVLSDLKFDHTSLTLIFSRRHPHSQNPGTKLTNIKSFCTHPFFLPSYYKAKRSFLLLKAKPFISHSFHNFSNFSVFSSSAIHSHFGSWLSLKFLPQYSSVTVPQIPMCLTPPQQ